MRFHHAFGVLLICSSLAACSFKKDDGQGDSAKPATPNVLGEMEKEQERQASAGQLSTANSHLEILETDEPGFYKVIAHWPKDIKRVQIQLNDEQALFRSFPQHPNFYEFLVRAETDVKVVLQSFDTLGPASVITLVQKVPADYIISKDYSLNKDLSIEVNRVFFLGRGQLRTNGFNLNIIANKIIVRSPEDENGKSPLQLAQILTTIPGSIAQDSSLHKGSNISIIAKSGKGQMIIGMVGFNGRDGISGSVQENGLGLSRANPPDLTGPNGTDGVLRVRKMTCPKNKDGPVCSDESVTCERHPTNGGNGKPGRVGLAGENGINGGDAGTLLVTITDTTDTKLLVIHKIGTGGKGGSGGAGFPGGLGGTAGKNPGSPCNSASNGTTGASGPTGPAGKNGSDGKEGSVSTNIPKFEVIRL